MRNARIFAILIALLWTPALAHAARNAAPSSPSPDPLHQKAIAAFDAGKLEAFITEAEGEARNLLREPVRADHAKLIAIASWREFSKRYADAKTSDETLRIRRWLMNQPDLFATIMLATHEKDDPAKVLEVVQVLWGTAGDNIAATPDLATAFCVVWDKTPEGKDKKGKPLKRDDERLSLLYRYYTDASRRFSFDYKTLPWELSLYLVDNAVGEDEIVWARQRYRARGFVPSAYFDVPYDMGVYRDGVSQSRGKKPYTLANIEKFGGVCRDQAYYAAHVGKVFGIPATVVSGMGAATGGGHAWIGFLEQRNKRMVWNFNEARYSAHLYWSGQVIDPQTGETLTDADVSLSAELGSTPRQSRLASTALWKLSDLAPREKHLNVFTTAIDLSPGNRAAWMSIAAMGAAGELNAAETRLVAEVVQRFAFTRYPDFAFAVSKRLVEGRPPEVQLDAFDAIARAFTSRPDLVAAARIAQGDLFRSVNRKDAALTAYGEVLNNHLNVGPIVLTAVQRVDEMLRESRDFDRLVKIYQRLWTTMRVPEASAFAAETPYYSIGDRYATLLEELQRDTAARTIRNQLSQLDTSKK